MLSLQNVHLRFDSLTVLEGVSLRVQPGEILALLGPSGCGKSSVLRLLGGLLTPSQGAVEGAPGLRFGSVFQHATLLPWASVLDNVALPLRLQGLSGAAARAQAVPWLDRVGLSGFGAALPHALSGGMQMRVALARALVLDPDVLLLDEPFGALDEITRERLGQELLAWCGARAGLGAVLVTHSVFEAVALADRVVVMDPRPGRVRLEMDLRPAREAGAATTAPWTQQDAYFQAVREAQQALAAGVHQAVMAQSLTAKERV